MMRNSVSCRAYGVLAYKWAHMLSLERVLVMAVSWHLQNTIKRTIYIYGR